MALLPMKLDFFFPELTSGERRALREMEARQPLLADAYRETLALRLNASRLTASATGTCCKWKGALTGLGI